jgi:hypothetical protein
VFREVFSQAHEEDDSREKGWEEQDKDELYTCAWYRDVEEAKRDYNWNWELEARHYSHTQEEDVSEEMKATWE